METNGPPTATATGSGPRLILTHYFVGGSPVGTGSGREVDA